MTLPQAPSAAPGSDPVVPSAFPGVGTPPADLICPPDEIFDRARVCAALRAACTAGADETDLRREIVRILLDARKQGMDCIAAGLARRPFEARGATRAYTWLTDCIVACTYHMSTTRMHPLPTPTEGERLSLLAVGGYGRGEMATFSDVDLLFLTPYKITPWAESVIESMLYILWDMRLKVGHASRTVKDCLRLGREDYTIRTALLEHRYLVGDEKLAGDLSKTLRKDLFKGSERDFIEAKLHEREQRHLKQGERYVVEPNVKEGKGGLRDLQSLYWIAKYVHGVENVEDLVRLKVFRDDELATFQKAENFLWAVRCHLHLASGRANELLSFDKQVEVAERMGYRDKGGRRAVEHFMQDYFRQATRVGDLTRIFLTKLEAMHAKGEPLLERLFSRRRKVKEGYKVVHGRLAIDNEKAFLSDPLNLLRLFEEGLRTGMLIHPDAMRLVAANLHRIDDDMRNDLLGQFSYFLPHLLALSASSPFWQGEDTGLASWRLTVFDNLPRTGLPPVFPSFEAYRRAVNLLVSNGIIEDGTKIWWDARPSDRFPTLEARICDVSPVLDDGIAIAALVQCILRMLYRLRRLNQRWRIYDPFLLEENRWRAQRYGVTGGLIDLGRGEVVAFDTLLGELMDLVAEDAEALGCANELERLASIVADGGSAGRQRAVWNAAIAAGEDAGVAGRRVVQHLMDAFTEGL